MHRIKTNGSGQADATRDYSASWARRSLNILKQSLHHPMTLPRIDDDGDEEMEIDEEAVEKLCDQVDMQLAGNEDCHKVKVGVIETFQSNPQLVATENEPSGRPNTFQGAHIEEQGSEDTDVSMEEGISEQVENQNETMIVDCAESVICTTGVLDDTKQNQSVRDQSAELPLIGQDETPRNGPVNCVSPSSITIGASDVAPVLKSPTPCVSPRVSSSRKSLRTSSMLTASQKDLKEDNNLGSEAVHMSLGKSVKSGLSETVSAQTKRNARATTENLAASLHRGLEIIDSHRQSSALRRSMFRYSYRPADFQAIVPIHKVDVGVQTSHSDELPLEDTALFICSNCKNRTELDVKEVHTSANLQIVPVEDSECTDKCKKRLPKVSNMI